MMNGVPEIVTGRCQPLRGASTGLSFFDFQRIQPARRFFNRIHFWSVRYVGNHPD